MPNIRNWCDCGRQKDYRAARCAICSKRSYPIDRNDRFTRNQVEQAVATSETYSEAGSKLGYSRVTIANLVRDYGLSTEHMRRTRGRRPTAKHVFISTEKRRNSTVRKYILEHDLMPYVCYSCRRGPVWNGKPLTLQLEHRDGIGVNNEFENLGFMCPNCHSQTDTYCGRNSLGVAKRRRQ